MLGGVRGLLFVPAYGPVLAVLIELPVVMSLSWIAARRILRGRPSLAGARARLAMGGFALVLLIAAQAFLAFRVFDLPVAPILAAQLGAAGLLSLGGQVFFAATPWLQHLTRSA